MAVSCRAFNAFTAGRGAGQSGYTGYINVLDNQDSLVIHMHTGARTLQVFTPPDSRAPAWSSAAGRALLAGFSSSDLLKKLPDSFEDANGSTPRSLAELNEALIGKLAIELREAASQVRKRVGNPFWLNFHQT